MNKPEICQTIEEALKKGTGCKPDDNGFAYYTFRISELASMNTGEVASQFVAAGWHLVCGNPVTVAATTDIPKHLIFTMLRHEPRPVEPRPSFPKIDGMRIRGKMRLEGGFTGELDGVILRD